MAETIVAALAGLVGVYLGWKLQEQSARQQRMAPWIESFMGLARQVMADVDLRQFDAESGQRRLQFTLRADSASLYVVDEELARECKRLGDDLYTAWWAANVRESERKGKLGLPAEQIRIEHPGGHGIDPSQERFDRKGFKSRLDSLEDSLVALVRGKAPFRQIGFYLSSRSRTSP